MLVTTLATLYGRLLPITTIVMLHVHTLNARDLISHNTIMVYLTSDMTLIMEVHVSEQFSRAVKHQN